MKPQSIILLIIVAIFAVGLGVSFSGSASTYSSFAEAQKNGGTVHIVGTWVNREQSSYDPQTDSFRFFLQDTLGGVSAVLYRDPKPNDFDKAEKIVVIGKYESPEYFTAEKIVMKCPSKYGDTEVK